jgi:CPA2 family monovalent cation:H+ antiporter-2
MRPASILEHAGMKRASYLVLTLPHTSARVAVVTAARNLNENARIFVRAHYLSERDYLEDAGATAAVFEEGEAAVALTKLVLSDTGAHRDDVERHVRDLRLQLILENVTAIRTQRVRSMMIPWPRVRTLATTYSRSEVLQHFAQHPHTHWAVVDPRNAAVIGYVRAKDFSIHDTADDSWLHLVRRLSSVQPDDDIETVLLDMRNDRDTVRMVEQLGEPIGLVTLDDILDHVVGRVRRQHPHEAVASLKDALAAGGVVLELTGQTADAVITELAGAIPAGLLPPNSTVCDLALQRERDVSTDLGIGVAIPHARCPRLTRPVVMFGRAAHGVAFSEESTQPVRLVFLVVTPQEQPDTQLALLAQLSQVVASHATRNRLLMATTENEVIEAVVGR